MFQKSPCKSAGEEKIRNAEPLKDCHSLQKNIHGEKVFFISCKHILYHCWILCGHKAT